MREVVICALVAIAIAWLIMVIEEKMNR